MVRRGKEGKKRGRGNREGEREERGREKRWGNGRERGTCLSSFIKEKSPHSSL
jgi:hypothetical protein